MKILLINILFLWGVISSLITNIFATVQYKIGEPKDGPYIKKLFRDYYYDLNPYGTRNSILEFNDVLGKELCHTIVSTLVEHVDKNPEKKTCDLTFDRKQIKLDDDKFVWIKLGKCTCRGEKSTRHFHIREYGDQLSNYFVLDIIDDQNQLMKRSKDKYLGAKFVFDTLNKILWDKHFQARITISKLTPPQENAHGTSIQNQNLPPGGSKRGNQSKKTKAT